jgi:hypothetical protein
VLIASIFDLPRAPGCDVTGIRWARLPDGTLEVFYPSASGIHRGVVELIGRDVEWLAGAPSSTAWEPVTFALACDLERREPLHQLDAPAEPGLIDAVIARWRGAQRRAA